MNIEKQILDFLKSNPESSSSQILENIEEKKSIATIKRVLSKLIPKKYSLSNLNLPEKTYF